MDDTNEETIKKILIVMSRIIWFTQKLLSYNKKNLNIKKLKQFKKSYSPTVVNGMNKCSHYTVE